MQRGVLTATLCDQRWRLSEAVLWREWDGDVVVFAGASGATHHFTEFAAWLFVRIAAAPSTVDELRTTAIRDVDVTGDGTLDESIDATLRLFYNLLLMTPHAAAVAAPAAAQ
ncbi:MAG TPA: HPr-rel-A system PqqD family peptide chaperone [Stellaceae bacterium]